ncbi:EAL domain-containing protein [Vibrio vulnificus]|nr:EAL domain-containing protein [Vibrio vulnificus]
MKTGLLMFDGQTGFPFLLYFVWCTWMNTFLNIKHPLFATLLLFASIFSITLWIIHLVTDANLREKELLVSQVAMTQGKNLEKELHTALIASTQILAVEVIQNNGNMDNFEEYAQEILSLSKVISNLQLAPNGIIQSIYPLAGNEKAIGHNLLKDDARKKEALNAVESGKLTLAGPFTLKQGGVGMIARRPVFLKQQGESRFWGFVSALILLENLIASSDLQELQKDNLHFQLSRIHPDTNQVDAFYGESISQDWISSKITIDVPNNQWTLIVGLPQSQQLFASASVQLAIALIISGFASFCFFYYVTLPKKLQHAVEQKTFQLKKLANTDMLTGLDNRRKFTDVLNQILQKPDALAHRHALLYLDIDNFKQINDQLGHYVGDQVLKVVAQRLCHHVSDAQSITRISGDEFAVLLEYQEFDGLKLRLSALIAALSQSSEHLPNSHRLTVSVGVVLIPQDGQDSTTLMKHVDFAMYQAKSQGRNQYCFFDKFMKLRDDEKIQLVESLKIAIEQNQFVLHYQPIYDIQSHQIHCYEALVRWLHPTKGLLYPASFIELAEQSGLINEIGDCVLAQACQFIAQAAPEKPIVSINISASQLSDPQLFERFIGIIQKYGVDAHSLKFELTETTLMQNIQSCTNILLKFKQLGIQIAIDDFGTGYSSLAVLKDVPANYLKIDKSFIDQINSNTGDQKVAQSIITLAHHLDMQVIAEGVEQIEQEELLAQFQCDFGQGYLFGRPAPLDSIRANTKSINSQAV